MRSNPSPPLDSVLEAARSALLPEKGAEFRIQYYAGEVPVKYGEEEHTWVSAISDGLQVVVEGGDSYVAMRRQKKPMLPEVFNGEDGAYRRLLVIGMGGVWVHILGRLVVVAKQRMNIGQIVNDRSLTEGDARLMEALRKR